MHTVSVIHLFGPPEQPQAVYQCAAAVSAERCPGQEAPFVLTARIALSHTVEIH